MEVPLGEVVRLEFAVPTPDVVVHALTPQPMPSAMGFSFWRPLSQLENIPRAFRQLAMTQSTVGDLECQATLTRLSGSCTKIVIS